MKFNGFSILNNLICGVTSDYIFQAEDIIKMTAFPQNKILFAKTQIPFKCMYVPAKIAPEHTGKSGPALALIRHHRLRELLLCSQTVS